MYVDIHRAALTLASAHLCAEANIQALLLEVTAGFLGELLIGMAVKSGRASSTITSLPRRFHTLPSSRPMTPAPMTHEPFGHGIEFERAP